MNPLPRILALNARIDALIAFDDGRPRNPDGQFEPETGNDFDPATMRAAYGPLPTPDKGMSAASGLGGTDAAAQQLARRLSATGFRVAT